MSRAFAAFVIFGIDLTAVAAPGPKEKGDGLYYPTRVGDKLVYEVRAGDTVTERTDVVTRVEKRDGALLVTVRPESTGRETLVPLTVSVSDEGLHWVASDGRELPTPSPFLKLRAAPGDTWTWDPGDSDASPFTRMKVTMGKEEEVEVPAGKFKARRIETEFDPGPADLKVTTWMAPRVGVVKVVIAPLVEGELVQVLKSFTPGK